MFDWSNNSFSADYSLGSFSSPTLSTGLPDWDLGGNDPVNFVEQTALPNPTPTGGFFNNALKTISATADTFLAGVGKVYEIDNAIQSRRLQQKQIESGLKIAELETRGGLELRQAQLTAQKDIGLAQAKIATDNAQAQIRSSQGASFVTMPAAIPWPLIGIAVAGYLIVSKGMK